MVKILCPPDLQQEIYDWLITKDTEMFGDVRREDFFPKDGHAGIFEVNKIDGGLVTDCDGYLFSRGHFLDEEVPVYFKELRRAFPSAEVNGAFSLGLSDDWWAEFEVKTVPGTPDVVVQEL